MRDAGMPANLTAIADTNAPPGPSLTFAHNNHLHRNQTARHLASMDLR